MISVLDSIIFLIITPTKTSKPPAELTIIGWTKNIDIADINIKTYHYSF